MRLERPARAPRAEDQFGATIMSGEKTVQDECAVEAGRREHMMTAGCVNEKGETLRAYVARPGSHRGFLEQPQDPREREKPQGRRDCEQHGPRAEKQQPLVAGQGGGSAQ